MTSLNLAAQTVDRDGLLEALKRYAKAGKKAEPNRTLSACQDLIAATLGYGNWSQLHKDFRLLSAPKFALLKARVLGHPKIGPHLILPNSPFDRAAAREEMKAWVESHYTPLVDFAYYDNESENGFAWPDVELSAELQGEFSDQFPLEFIDEVAAELEEAGPWGVEDYGSDADS